jgi:hypothetical protein
MESTKIALFKGIRIRKTFNGNEWWFVIEDVVVALTGSVQPAGYIKDMRRRDPELSKGWGQIATPLPVQTAGGDIAGGARKQLEKRLGRSVVSGSLGNSVGFFIDSKQEAMPY